MFLCLIGCHGCQGTSYPGSPQSGGFHSIWNWKWLGNCLWPNCRILAFRKFMGSSFVLASEVTKGIHYLFHVLCGGFDDLLILWDLIRRQSAWMKKIQIKSQYTIETKLKLHQFYKKNQLITKNNGNQRNKQKTWNIKINKLISLFSLVCWNLCETFWFLTNVSQCMCFESLRPFVEVPFRSLRTNSSLWFIVTPLQTKCRACEHFG